jgi:hypothetical protein
VDRHRDGATNTAARLELLTKGTGYQLFLADATKARLRADAYDLVFVDESRCGSADDRQCVVGQRNVGAGPASGVDSDVDPPAATGRRLKEQPGRMVSDCTRLCSIAALDVDPQIARTGTGRVGVVSSSVSVVGEVEALPVPPQFLDQLPDNLDTARAVTLRASVAPRGSKLRCGAGKPSLFRP